MSKFAACLSKIINDSLSSLSQANLSNISFSAINYLRSSEQISLELLKLAQKLFFPSLCAYLPALDLQQTQCDTQPHPAHSVPLQLKSFQHGCRRFMLCWDSVRTLIPPCLCSLQTRLAILSALGHAHLTSVEIDATPFSTASVSQGLPQHHLEVWSPSEMQIPWPHPRPTDQSLYVNKILQWLILQ